jgi:hypothetical protein
MTMPSIFGELKPLSVDDQRLIDGYVNSGRTTDDLPYSPEFEELVARLRESGDFRSERELITRLFRLRKAARLPQLGRRSLPIGFVSDGDMELAEFLLKKAVGHVGSRDQLPYTPQFEDLFERFNSESSRQLDRHQFWRLLARVAK